MKIIYDKEKAKNKKEQIDKQYFEEAESLHIEKRLKGIIAFLLAILFAVGSLYLHSLSIDKNVSDLSFLFYIGALLAVFISIIAALVSMFNTDDSAYHYPDIIYPADIQFYLFSKDFRIKDIDISEHFHTMRMTLIGVDKNKKVQKSSIEIPHKDRGIGYSEPVLDLEEETYYIPFAKL